MESKLILVVVTNWFCFGFGLWAMDEVDKSFECAQSSLKEQEQIHKRLMDILRYAFDKEVAELLFKSKNIDINFQDEHGCTALIAAVYYGRKEIVELLLGYKGIKINISDSLCGTALITAVLHGGKAMVELVLSREDVDLNAQDKWGSTALCAAKNNEEITVLLLMNGAEVTSLVIQHILEGYGCHKIDLLSSAYLLQQGRIRKARTQYIFADMSIYARILLWCMIRASPASYYNKMNKKDMLKLKEIIINKEKERCYKALVKEGASLEVIAKTLDRVENCYSFNNCTSMLEVFKRLAVENCSGSNKVANNRINNELSRFAMVQFKKQDVNFVYN